MSYSWDSSYSRGRGRSSPTAKPVEVDKEYDVDVTEIIRKVDGIARIEGFVVFVGNITIGKKIRIKVDRFAKATIV
jgi:predicted RNA-binding protein with TRAM domain